jgi:hypothetical protein
MAIINFLAPYVWPQVDTSGNPYSGAKLYSYLAGTTTQAPTYPTTTSIAAANANPIIFDSKGEPSNGSSVVLVCMPTGAEYKFALYTSADVLVASWDNVKGINDFAVANIAQWYTNSPVIVPTITAPTQFTIPSANSAFSVGRRIKLVTDSPATYYGTITDIDESPFTITATIDGGASLAGNGVSVDYGILTSTNPSIPKIALPNGSTATTQSAGTSDTQIATTAFVTTANAAASIAPSVQNFRLSLTTAVPVTTTDVASSTSVFAVPYTGKKIGLYYSNAWVIVTSAEVTLALGTITSDLGYDVFCYTSDGSTLSIELLSWGSSASRSTALGHQDGVLVKGTDSTRRYMGSFLTISTTTTCDTEAKRYLWNNYHRVDRSLKYPIVTASWTVPAAAWRQAGADTANQLMLFAGLVEDSVSATYIAQHSHSSAGVLWHTALGLNTTSAPTGFNATGGSVTAGGKLSTCPTITAAPILGKNYIAALEYAVSITTTGYSTTALYVSGLYGTCRA